MEIYNSIVIEAKLPMYNIGGSLWMYRKYVLLVKS